MISSIVDACATWPPYPPRMTDQKKLARMDAEIRRLKILIACLDSGLPLPARNTNRPIRVHKERQPSKANKRLTIN